MRETFSINEDDFAKFEQAIKKYPEHAERAINAYLHGEGAELISNSVTNHIPVSTGRYSAHRNLQKKYKHKKTLKHARDAKWYLKKEYNLALNIKNKNDYYYLYFVKNGLGTSERSGGIDFVEIGLNNVYNRLVNGLTECLTWEVKND